MKVPARGPRHRLQAIDDSYSSIVTSKHFDHETTISFPVIQNPDNPLPKLRSETIANEERMAALRRQIDCENARSNQLRQFLLSASSIAHQAPRDGDPRVADLLTQHNSLLAEQVSSIPSSDNQLASRISVLKKQIENERSRTPATAVKRDEFGRVRRKSKLYKREIDQLSEFVRKELEFEREEDEQTIGDLQKVIDTLSKELAELNSKDERDLQKWFNQITSAKATLCEWNATLAGVQTRKTQLQAAIDAEAQKNSRLNRELSILRSVLDPNRGIST
jgi:chromosome segregation ATPase